MFLINRFSIRTYIRQTDPHFLFKAKKFFFWHLMLIRDNLYSYRYEVKNKFELLLLFCLLLFSNRNPKCINRKLFIIDFKSTITEYEKPIILHIISNKYQITSMKKGSNLTTNFCLISVVK